MRYNDTMKNIPKTPALLLLHFVSATTLTLNFFFWDSTVTGIAFSLIYFAVNSFVAGGVFLPRHSTFWKTSIGVLLFLSYLLVVGSSVYYFHSLSEIFIAGIIVISPLLFFLPGVFSRPRKAPSVSVKIFSEKFDFKTILLATVFLLLEALAFYTLYKSSTGEAIRSPWQKIPGDFFLIYFLSTLSLIIISIYCKKHALSLILISIHFLLSSSVVLFVYKLGYGFDPFIHRATENTIADYGIIAPKPLYYIGQYTTIVLLSKILALPVAIIDLWLVPLLFSIYAPLTTYFAFSNIIRNVRFLPLAALAVLVFPFTSFVVTTPQSFANFITLIIIILSPVVLFGKQKHLLLALSVLTASALFIHPISGIPALIFLALVATSSLPTESKKTFSVLQKIIILEIFSLSIIAFPIIFIINSQVSKNLIAKFDAATLTRPEIIKDIFSFVSFTVNNNYNLVLDVAYWFNNNFHLIILGFSLLGLSVLIRKYNISSAYIYIISFIVFIINFIVLRALISFPSLIEYEQANYPNRLREIGYYFLIPIFSHAVLFSVSRARKKTSALMLALALFLAIFISSSLYISYPRADEYYLDRGYNLTQSDINSVRFIEESAENDFIVLANQMTSVAAIKEYGFKKYYRDAHDPEKSHFYYPIPTGDVLYEYYLTMVYDAPSKKTALMAADVVGVDSVYLVLDSYWDSYDRLVEEAKQEADFWQDIDQGKAHVFLFTRNTKERAAE